jgi:hypothetical protein
MMSPNLILIELLVRDRILDLRMVKSGVMPSIRFKYLVRAFDGPDCGERPRSAKWRSGKPYALSTCSRNAAART